MSNITYDQKWQEAMSELDDQVLVEDPTLDVEGSSGYTVGTTPEVTLMEAFQHYACLYIKYIQIFIKLEDCYDQMVHPQKRIDVKQVLEIVMTRIIDLKHNLVKWNPPNPDVQTQPVRNFPWEYVNLDDILVNLKLPPAAIEIPVPRYFIEDNLETLCQRDKFMDIQMNILHGRGQIYLEEDILHQQVEGATMMTMEEAIQIIQRNERGRQGKQRGFLVKELRDDEKQRRAYDIQSHVEMDPAIAASHIQRIYRGFQSRLKTIKEREDELIFIGMKPKQDDGLALKTFLEQGQIKRKTEQMDHKEGYQNGLQEIRDTVLEEEGPSMKEKMLEERRAWFTDIMSHGDFPEDLNGFYKSKYPHLLPTNESSSTSSPLLMDNSSNNAAASGGKKTNQSSASTAADKKKNPSAKTKQSGDKKSKKKEVPELPAPEQLPTLTGPTPTTNALSTTVKRFEEIWLNRDESNNFYQKHDIQLAKDVVRSPVETEIRQQVDELLLLQLKHIKTQLENAAISKKKRKKKGKSGKKKKKSNEKVKKKGSGESKKKKKGGKKSKLLPGDKIAELKSMDMDQMLNFLLENKIIVLPHPYKMKDLKGDYNYLGTTSSIDNDNRDHLKNWIPFNPSMAQLRQSVMEYVVLPLGSEFARANTRLIRSLLFYGPKGCGKSMMVQAIAHEIGALLFNFSPLNLNGKFTTKLASTKLIHTAMMVAKDKKMAPIIIYMDDCEQFFPNKKKTEGLARFKKDLIAYLNCITQEDRIIFIGCTSDTTTFDVKDCRTFFDKHLFFPCPDYASRLQLWKHYILAALHKYGFDKSENLPPGFEYLSTLAQISSDYSSESIQKVVNATLNHRRVQRLKKQPLLETEFIGGLSKRTKCSQAEIQKFRDFTAEITGLKAMREKIRAIQAAKASEKESGKKKTSSKK